MTQRDRQPLAPAFVTGLLLLLGLAAAPLSRQASNRFLSDEIAGLAVTAVLVSSKM